METIKQFTRGTEKQGEVHCPFCGHTQLELVATYQRHYWRGNDNIIRDVARFACRKCDYEFTKTGIPEQRFIGMGANVWHIR